MRSISNDELISTLQVFERSKFANEIGAAIHMCPNATRILSFYEFDYEGGLATPLQEVRTPTPAYVGLSHMSIGLLV